MSSVYEEQARTQLGEQLTAAFAGDCTEEQISDAIDRAWHRFDQAPIRDFVPLLAGKIARAELRRVCDSASNG